MLNMTTPQNRQPKGIAAGGQFAPDTHAEAALLLVPGTRDVILAPGDGDTLPELADGDVIETLNVTRSGDAVGYWISPAETVNIENLITDAEPRYHGQTLELTESRAQVVYSCLVNVRDVEFPIRSFSDSVRCKHRFTRAEDW